jgi:hypothetical protein
MVITKGGNVLATAFVRIVHGGRGDYMEISREQIIPKSLHIPDDQRWRLSYDKAYYDWYTTDDGSKVYFQKRLVGYADYKIGFYYIDPTLVDVT